jgi:hypothetical protein
MLDEILVLGAAVTAEMLKKRQTMAHPCPMQALTLYFPPTALRNASPYLQWGYGGGFQKFLLARFSIGPIFLGTIQSFR